MELQLGDVQTTALIPLAVKASETLRVNPRIRDQKAVDIIRHLNIDTKKYDKFLTHEGVIARTIMLDRHLKIESKKDAQNAPTPITTYALFCDGEYVTNEQMNDKKFLKLVER